MNYSHFKFPFSKYFFLKYQKKKKKKEKKKDTFLNKGSWMNVDQILNCYESLHGKKIFRSNTNVQTA